MVKVSAALQLSMLAILAAIPAEADSLHLSGGLGRASISCCQAGFSLGDTTVGPVLVGSLVENSISIGPIFAGAPDCCSNVGIQTGSLIDSTDNTFTFSGGTVNLGGLLFSRDAPDICQTQGAMPFFLLSPTIWCNYGILSTGVLLGDFTITASANPGLPGFYTFAGVAQFPFVPIGNLASLPTILYQGPLTGDIYGVQGGLSGNQFNIGFDLAFSGTGTPVPEPSSLLMLATIIALVLGVTRRSFNRKSPIRSRGN
jgi:hypothetical protein